MSLFDDIVTRDVNCRKYGQLQQMYGTTDVLPLWIADMDFATPRANHEHAAFGGVTACARL